MDIVKISCIAILGIFIALVLRTQRNDFAQIVSISLAFVIFAYALVKAEAIVNSINEINRFASIDSKYLKIMIKMTGITYVSDFASSICKDNGYQAIAMQIETFSKLSLLLISLPVVTGLLQTISGL